MTKRIILTPDLFHENLLPPSHFFVHSEHNVNNTHLRKLGNYFGRSLTANNHTVIRPPQLGARPQGVGKGPAKERAPSIRMKRQSSLGGDRGHEFPQPAQAASTANTANTCPTSPSHWFSTTSSCTDTLHE